MLGEPPFLLPKPKKYVLVSLIDSRRNSLRNLDRSFRMMALDGDSVASVFGNAKDEDGRFLSISFEAYRLIWVFDA